MQLLWAVFKSNVYLLHCSNTFNQFIRIYEVSTNINTIVKDSGKKDVKIVSEVQSML